MKGGVGGNWLGVQFFPKMGPANLCKDVGTTLRNGPQEIIEKIESLSKLENLQTLKNNFENIKIKQKNNKFKKKKFYKKKFYKKKPK